MTAHFEEALKIYSYKVTLDKILDRDAAEGYLPIIQGDIGYHIGPRCSGRIPDYLPMNHDNTRDM